MLGTAATIEIPCSRIAPITPAGVNRAWYTINDPSLIGATSVASNPVE